MKEKWEIAEARTTAMGKLAFKLSKMELEATCDGKQATCDLFKGHCTVGYCRRVEV